EGVICSGFSLEAGQSKTCTKTGSAIVGQYENLATVEGIDPNNQKITDKDPSHYFGKEPSLTCSTGYKLFK